MYCRIRPLRFQTFQTASFAALMTCAAFTTANCLDPARAEPKCDIPDINDQTISDRIDDVLSQDPGVVSTRVDVSTSDGITTLTGRVTNILAKERAARIAETVKGVRAVVNRIAVSPSARLSDDQIKREVQAALIEDPATDSYEIHVSVKDGRVTLAGAVDSFQERELAKRVAKGVRGVVAIEDRIALDYKADRADLEILKDIEQTLRWNTYVDDFLIDVSLDDGKVVLSGTVGSAAERRMAESDAWVAGVHSVDATDLKVEGWARDRTRRADKYVVKSEEELRVAVEDALRHDPRVVSFHVDVDASGNTITLRGEVDNLKAKRAAEQDANNTVGVSAVDNRLKVRPDSWPGDSAIAEDIRAALIRDPHIERFDISVTVLNGTAYLYGTVNSYFQKNRADDVASRVAGVVDVKCQLSVDRKRMFLNNPYVDDFFVREDNLIDYELRAPSKSDRQIKSAIEGELWWSPFVNSENVDVTVEDGIATLTGSVGTWSERQAATKNAFDGGATLVDNDLDVAFEYQ